MASSVLNSLPFVFLVAGLTLLATSFAISRRAKRYRRNMQAMLALEGQGLAPLDLPRQAWPLLEDGGWQQMTLVGHWFGGPVQMELGQTPALKPTQVLRRDVVCQVDGGDDVQLTLTLCHSGIRGEVWLFAEQLAQVFVLLLETGVRARTESMSIALAERARLTLYLQHDMRNLAQWVGWVCADFAACEDDASLLSAGKRLRDNAPLAQERVHRLRDALGQKPVVDNPREVDLALAISKAAHLAGVEVHLSGEAQAWIARGLLARVLDNLFSNLAPNWREVAAQKPTFHLRMRVATRQAVAQAEIEFLSPWPQGERRLPTSQLFEPFTSGRPGGLGLGLYQARKSLSEGGGQLSAEATEAGLSFRLTLPAAPL
jgi:signal transduction histidine kinase